MAVTALARRHRMDGFQFSIVVVFLSQLKGVLVEEGTIGEDNQFPVFT